MRTQSEVLTRLEEMRVRLLRNRKDRMLSKGYINCIHNVRLKVKNVGLVGLCQNPELLKKRGRPLVCNDDEFSACCLCFKGRHTEDSVEREFDEILKSPARCGEEYPKLAVLIWFFQGERIDRQSRFSRLAGHIRCVFSEAKKVVTLKWL